ncbi:hypothetical protein [Pseudomonas japonica]|uniref:Uncharacterized protein n=1 Tax=Pseudomonas japonica TaxID=256466 RepID=A0A239A4A8_9PSED|nr:hypothetical protein [Pseudomonas japonica]SNR90380.1 hypothetical protein SAMN05444352_101178 [Pseudomonas japonica]
MNLEIARTLFLLAALATATAAAAAWEEPRPGVISASSHCPLPRVVKPQVDVKPDHDLLLFLFGMSQGLRAQG